MMNITECNTCHGGTGQPYPCICSTEGWKKVQAATSASDERYQARVRDLEEAGNRYKAIVETYARQYEVFELATPTRAFDKVLSTTTPDTALQRKVLEARIDEHYQESNGTEKVFTRVKELRAQLAELGE